MKSLPKILLAVQILFFVTLHSQNLVNNPGFETHTGCPTASNQWYLCPGWDNCNGKINPGLWGTPDYFNTCGTPDPNPNYNYVPPVSSMAYCYPHSGNGMMGFAGYNAYYTDFREYLQGSLSTPMTSGNTYTVSFWLTTGQQPVYHSLSINNFGVYFSKAATSQSTYEPILVNPQFEITTLITDTLWVKHTFTISPCDTLNYFTLGNFRNDTSTWYDITYPDPFNWSWPYWFVDDFSVVGGSTLQLTPHNVTCYGNSNGSINATGIPPLAASYTWFPSGGNSANATGLAPGTYTFSFTDNCGSVNSKTVSINQSSSALTMTLTPPINNICFANTVTLSTNVNGGTAPYSYLWSNSSTLSTLSFTAPISTVNYTVNVTDGNGCTLTSTTSVTGKLCDGLPEYLSAQLEVFPNPVTDYLNITFEKQPDKIVLWNSFGQVVMTKQDHFERIDMRELKEGIYYLVFIKNEKPYSQQKLIKTER